MAAADSLLFHVDSLVIDGKPVAIEDGSAMLTGAARFKFEPVLSSAGSGNDFNKRSRVPTTLKFKLQYGNTVNPSDYAAMSGVQITARDQQSGRRALMPICSFADMGDIGGGSVDVTFNVLAPVQWL